MMRPLACCALLLFVGACATESKQSTTVDAAFACDGGARLSVTFDNKAAVAIVRTQAGGLHVLTRAITGSGYGYEAEGRVLRGKGREATWTDRGTAALKCRDMEK